MEEFLLGLVIGAVLCGGGRHSRSGMPAYEAVNAWFNRRRHWKLRTKAEQGGFQHLYDEEYRHYEHIPFGLQNPAYCVRAFQRALRRHNVVLA
ncbi:hypothetical protein A8H39_00705 [Paraburkholderia fungorum]|uniref:hypothetical protein n=1 Tax=Paraburkholderia fungorum TaxID=134537 RepID=UPI000485008A|nr:hypothetical protein [Paraburkholderia fungorum]PNE59700.1 hypothetical protein A8H39_00705 [Paraburkholderia fungorum]